MKRKLKVLFVIPGEKVGSGMIFAKRQIKSIERSGVASLEFYFENRSTSRLPSQWLKLHKLVRRHRPHLIHAHFGTITSLISIFHSVPLIVTFRGSDLNKNSNRSFTGNAMALFISQFSSLFARKTICVSEQLKDRLWFRCGQATVIPSGVDTNLFHPIKKSDARALLRWNLDEFVALFNLGHARSNNKRLDLAQAAIAKVVQGGIAARLEIMSGEIAAEHVPIIMNACDVVLMLSDYEGSPNVVKEAAACGLPIVSVDVGDVRETINGMSGCRIVERNPRAIAMALIDIYNRRDLKTNGRKIMIKLSLPAIAARVIRIYRDLLAPEKSAATPPTHLGS